MTEKPTKTEFKYICSWCKHSFTKKVGTYEGNSKHKGKCSSQVQCPKCHNFIKTFSGE